MVCMVKKVFLSMGLLCGMAVSSFATDETTITTALENIEAEKPKQARKVLVFSLTQGYRHKSIAIGKVMMRVMGEQTGAFEAVISDDLANFEPGKIDEFDAICFLNTTKEVFSPKKKELEKMSSSEKKEAEALEKRLKNSLMSYIKSGKGFIGIHAATDTFYDWPEYGEMIGGYFDGHPWRAKSDVSIRVEQGEEEHACCAHFDGGNLNFKEEIYQFKEPYDSKKLHILLRLDPEKMDLSKGKRKDEDYGVSWIKPHGEGRVFYSSLGHNNHIYDNPKVLQHFLKGMQWAIGDLDVVVKLGN